jgi:hypothetical protein
VADKDDGAALLGLEANEFVLHLRADQRVESRKRFVHQENGRFAGKRAGETDTLLHAA